MFKIQTLNNISAIGLERLPRDRYEVGPEVKNPDAVLVRSTDMHKLEVPASVRAIGRAGAGTNNIPVKAMSARGVPVFNAPGANGAGLSGLKGHRSVGGMRASLYNAMPETGVKALVDYMKEVARLKG